MIWGPERNGGGGAAAPAGAASARAVMKAASVAQRPVHRDMSATLSGRFHVMQLAGRRDPANARVGGPGVLGPPRLQAGEQRARRRAVEERVGQRAGDREGDRTVDLRRPGGLLEAPDGATERAADAAPGQPEPADQRD